MFRSEIGLLLLALSPVVLVGFFLFIFGYLFDFDLDPLSLLDLLSCNPDRYVRLDLESLEFDLID